MLEKLSIRWLWWEAGKPSTAKLNRQITFVVATFVVLFQCWKGVLATELFSMYIAVFTGVELAQRWQKGKLGEANDYTRTTVREENTLVRRDTGESGKRGKDAGASE